MRIIGYRTNNRDGKVLLEESTGEYALSNDIVKLFFFLVEEYDNTIRVCWDLDATVSLFLKLLGVAQCSKLKNTKRCHIAPFDVFYVPGKVFSVVHIPTRVKANLYGLEQYFTKLAEPQDLIEVQMLGEKLLQELKKMGVEPTKLTSPVAIYEECVMKNMDLPRLKDLPIKAAEFAYRAAGRLWIETHILGFFDKVCDYDLRSAFPEIAKDLTDTRGCYWKVSKEYQPKAIYGYVKCKVTIYDWVMVSPIIMEVEEGLLSPTGTWEGYLTKGELDFIDKWKIGEYKILEGYWAIQAQGAKLKKPLLKPMEQLLKYKQGTPLQALLAKRQAAGVYGKMLEGREEEFGPFFNPVWGAEISTQAKLQVGEFLYNHGIGPEDNEGWRKLVHIGVDGVMLTGPVSIDGSWREEYIGSALVFSSGLVYTNTTKPKGLTLEEVLKMIKEHPRTSYYQRALTRRLTLGDSLARHRLKDIGKSMEFSVSLSLINQGHDRVFNKLPQSGEQLLNNKYRSKPRRV